MSLREENRQIEKRHRPNDIAKSHSCQKAHAGFVIIYSYLIVRKYKPSPCVAQVNLHFTVSDSKTVWDYVPSVKNTYTTWRCIKVKHLLKNISFPWIREEMNLTSFMINLRAQLNDNAHVQKVKIKICTRNALLPQMKLKH